MKLTNAKVRKALRGSIKKWEDIVAGTTEDLGAKNCALCHMFIQDYGSCFGCPIKVDTCQFTCEGTPYDTWSYLSFDNRYADTPEKIKVAKAMLRYLKKLDTKFFVKGISV